MQFKKIMLIAYIALSSDKAWRVQIPENIQPCNLKSLKGHWLKSSTWLDKDSWVLTHNICHINICQTVAFIPWRPILIYKARGRVVYKKRCHLSYFAATYSTQRKTAGYAYVLILCIINLSCSEGQWTWILRLRRREHIRCEEIQRVQLLNFTQKQS